LRCNHGFVSKTVTSNLAITYIYIGINQIKFGIVLIKKVSLTYSVDAISKVIGYILLLGIIVISVGLVTMLAMPIIEDAKENAYLKNIEQGFTVLDSKGSLVTLGKSPTQLV